MAGYIAAVDQVQSLLKTAWDANAATAIGTAYVPELRWEMTDSAEEPSNTERPWARCTIRHSTADQRTFGEPGGRRFRQFGIVMIQLFAPWRSGRGSNLTQLLAQIVKDAYEGAATQDVTFRSVRFNEVGRSGPWYQINVIADLEWDELR
jgi:hypothetical protein